MIVNHRNSIQRGCFVYGADLFLLWKMKNITLRIAATLSLLAFMVSCNEKLQEPALGNLQDEQLYLSKIHKATKTNSQNELLVKFSDSEAYKKFNLAGVAKIERILPSVKDKEELEARFNMDKWYIITLEDGASVDEVSRSCAALSYVSSVQYSSIYSREAQPRVYYSGARSFAPSSDKVFNDPLLGAQWHYKNTGDRSIATTAVAGADINVDDVWKNLCCGDPEIIVAVIDEGVMYSHPDLAANMWRNPKEVTDGSDTDGNGYKDDIYGYNFAANIPDIEWEKTDENGNSGHGTHCAGTIAAVNNNGLGVSGVAGGSGKGDGCRIMSCQIFSKGAGGSPHIIARAIKYAADNGASIISCSFGLPISVPSDRSYYEMYGGAVEIDAVRYFEATKNNPVIDGGIAVFAAGNENHPYAHYPGATAEFISVSAFAPDMLPTYYTNYGPGCNIAAPGGEAYLEPYTSQAAMVLSTLPKDFSDDNSDYGYMQGTSMACPHVSGVVALALSYAKKQGKKFTVSRFKQMILSSVNDIDQKINKTPSKSYARNIRPNLNLIPYYHNVGTGAIDAWRLMMKIDGTPTSTATVGVKQWIDLSEYFGTASVSLTYLGVDVPKETVEAMGLQRITQVADANHPGVPGDGYAIVQFGRLYVHPAKVGSGRLTIKAVGGGDHVGGGDKPTGGMELEVDVSLVSRYVDGGNGIGGWL